MFTQLAETKCRLCKKKSIFSKSSICVIFLKKTVTFWWTQKSALSQCTADGDLYGTGLTDHKLFRQTSATLLMDWKEVRRLYYYFTSKEMGQTLYSIRPVYNNALQGKGIPNSKFHSKIPNSLRLHLIKYIYTKHVKVKKVIILVGRKWKCFP